MQKNVSGQKIGVQMITASDGSEFTGSVTVAVTGDAGTQATGSVGSGACTHEGHGYHTYAPAQAETNYDLIAFTFYGTGAITSTIQVFTRWDANVTHNAGTAITAASGIQEVKVASIAANAITATSIASDAITDAKVASDVTIASVTGAVGSVTGNVGGTINGLTATALKDFFDTDSTTTYSSAVSGSVVKEIADNAGGGTPPTASEIADEVETRTLDANVIQIGGDTQSATDLKDFADAGYDPSTNKVQGVVLTDTVTTYTGNTPQTGDNYARLGAPAGASVSADIAAIQAKTTNLPADPADASDIANSFNTLTALVAAPYYEFKLVPCLTSTAGVEVRLFGIVEKGGQRSAVASLDPTATCALDVYEHGSGSALFSISATTVSASHVFELDQALPGFTADRNYRYKATVVISAVTYTFEDAFPNLA